MCKSTYDKNVLNVLIKIRDGEDWQEKPESIENNAFIEILNYIYEKNLVSGLRRVPILGSGGWYSGAPVLTRNGLQFIKSTS